VKNSNFKTAKNDVCFLFLMASLLAIISACAIGSYLDPAQSRVGGVSAKTQDRSLALRVADEQAAQLLRAKPGR